MRFREFWLLYLRAHTLPGTRAIHYVATAIGVLAFIDALIANEPWILVAGIALAYVLAILAHWMIERNAPLIGVDPVWGAVADLRMVGLAITGGLEREFAKRNIPAHFERAEPIETDYLRRQVDKAACRALGHYERRFQWYALFLISGAALIAVLADLHDLIEPSGFPAYPIVQLGIPILAFAAALVLTWSAMRIRRSQISTTAKWLAAMERTLCDPDAEAAFTTLSRKLALQSARETSLKIATFFQLGLGTLAFLAAEFAEVMMSPAF